MFALLNLLVATVAPASMIPPVKPPAPLATAPTQSNQAQSGDFHALQLAVPDLNAFDREWAVKTLGANITTTSKLVRNKPTFSVIMFSGCQRDATGHCRIGVSFRTLTPAGKPYPGQDSKKVRAFDGEIADPTQIYLTQAVMALRIESGEALGKYRIEAIVTDEVAGKSLKTWQLLDAIEAQ